MRHPGATPGPVGALPIMMVQLVLGAGLIAAARRLEALRTAGPAARRAAVGVAAIAGLADEEQPLTPATGVEAKKWHGCFSPATVSRTGARWLPDGHGRADDATGESTLSS
jgi:hypothetical protein